MGKGLFFKAKEIDSFRTPGYNFKKGEDIKMAKFGIVREFFQFLLERKLWWITPIIVILLLLVVIIVLTESSAIMPFIYAIF